MIKSIFKYRRFTFWVFLGAIIISIAVVVWLLTNPNTEEKSNGNLTLGIYKVKDLEYLGAWSSSSPEYFLEEAKGRRYVIDQNYFVIDWSFATDGRSRIESYKEKPQYIKAELEGSIVLKEGEEPMTLDISKYKSSMSYKVLDSSGEDTNYRIFILDDNIWIGHYNWFGANNDSFWCEYIFSLEMVQEVNQIEEDSSEENPLSQITAGYPNRSYVEIINDEKTLSELFDIYNRFIFGEKVITIENYPSAYTVTFEFKRGAMATIVFIDKDHYGLFLPESSTPEYSPILNGNTEVYDRFYELYPPNR